MTAPIILPLDGSKLSESAIPYALDQAQKSNSTILLVRVAILPPATFLAEPGMFSADVYQNEYNAAKEEAISYLKAAAEQLEAMGVKVEVESKFGDPASVIIEAAKTHGASMIVIATHGRSGLGRVFYGSVAETILRSANVPVLLIPAGGREHKSPSI